MDSGSQLYCKGCATHRALVVGNASGNGMSSFVCWNLTHSDVDEGVSSVVAVLTLMSHVTTSMEERATRVSKRLDSNKRERVGSVGSSN